MPTTVPASSWRLADGYHSEARRTLILAAFDLVFQAEFWAKKNATRFGVAVQLCSSH